MRFESIKARNLGPFKHVDLDLAGIEGCLVAVVGENGAGKSTLLELLAAALYRECPTRGTLTDLATARDAFLEVRAVNGAAYSIRQTADSISKKGESLVLDAAGVPVLDGTKVSAFDAWAKSHVLPPELLYSSSFSPQGRRGFLDMSAADRKKLLVRMLDLERFERMADAAREHAKAEKALCESLRARLGDLAKPDMEALRLAYAETQARIDTAVEAVRVARVALDRARAAAGDAARARELAEQRRAAEGRHGAALSSVRDIESRLANNRAVLAECDAIRAAVERAAGLETELAVARAHVDDARAALTAAVSAEREGKAAMQRAEQEETKTAARVESIRVRLNDRDAISRATARIDTLKTQEQELLQQITDTEDRSSLLEVLVLSGKDQRIAVLRDAIVQIEEGDDDAPLAAWAHSARVSDDVLAARADKAPEELKAARSLLAASRQGLEKLRAELRTAERLAARAGEIAQAEADLAAAKVDLDAAQGRKVQATETWRASITVNTAADVSAKKAQDALDTLQSERKGLEPLLAKLAPLEQAQVRIEERTAQLVVANAALSACEAELAGLPVVTVETVDLSAYEHGVMQGEAAERAVREQRSRAHAAIEAAEAVNAKRAAIERDIAKAESELSDWTRLAQDLGRDGLQAMELDAALPEINTMANELLRSCHGTRFTVELRTDRLSSDGKKVIEGLPMRVIDVEKGRDADADTYSGGECVIAGEAVSLALTMLACRRSGLQDCTIVRDESGAALDPANARAYVAMLRMAARQLGARKVFLVSHSPEIQEMCDARILVGDGTAVIAA